MVDNNEKRAEWSCKPFVAMDGGDGHGGAPAEVIVTKGVGHVKEIENKGRSAAVTITVQTLKFPINGNINTDDPAFKIVEDAYDRGEPVQFRHEISRKKGIDRSKTMAELRTDPKTGKPSQDIARENTKKLFVGFGAIGDEITLSRQHLTSPASDNSASDGIAADSDDAVKPMPSTAAFTMPQGGELESRPWIGLNGDGGVNPGSYAVSCMPKMFFAMLERFPDESDETLRRFVEDIVRMADAMQVRVYKDCCNGGLKEANRFVNSHQVARQIMLDVIEHDLFGLPDTSDATSVKQWEGKIARYSIDLWKWAIENYKATISR